MLKKTFFVAVLSFAILSCGENSAHEKNGKKENSPGPDHGIFLDASDLKRPEKLTKVPKGAFEQVLYGSEILKPWLIGRMKPYELSSDLTCPPSVHVTGDDKRIVVNMYSGSDNCAETPKTTGGIRVAIEVQCLEGGLAPLLNSKKFYLTPFAAEYCPGGAGSFKSTYHASLNTAVQSHGETVQHKNEFKEAFMKSTGEPCLFTTVNADRIVEEGCTFTQSSYHESDKDGFIDGFHKKFVMQEVVGDVATHKVVMGKLLSHVNEWAGEIVFMLAGFKYTFSDGNETAQGDHF